MYYAFILRQFLLAILCKAIKNVVCYTDHKIPPVISWLHDQALSYISYVSYSWTSSPDSVFFSLLAFHFIFLEYMPL